MKHLELINRGKEAEIVLNLAGDKIQRTANAQLSKMKMAYRSGQIDLATLQSCIAAICTLDDLYAELVKDVKTGNSASKDLHEPKRPDTTHPSSN